VSSTHCFIDPSPRKRFGTSDGIDDVRRTARVIGASRITHKTGMSTKSDVDRFVENGILFAQRSPICDAASTISAASLSSLYHTNG
jgi:hypothetical protein